MSTKQKPQQIVACPTVITILKRRNRSVAQRLQAQLFTVAVSVSATMPTVTEFDKAFWCGVNYMSNDLLDLTLGYPPVFLLREFWAKLEERIES